MSYMTDDKIIPVDNCEIKIEDIPRPKLVRYETKSLDERLIEMLINYNDFFKDHPQCTKYELWFASKMIYECDTLEEAKKHMDEDNIHYILRIPK